MAADAGEMKCSMREREEIKTALSLCPGDSIDCEQDRCPYWEVRLCVPELHADTLELLKEQEEKKRKWLQTIADNQLANAPREKDEFMSLDEHLEREYRRGIYDGLQMAWEIVTEKA